MSMLKARLYEMELQKREQDAMADNATKADIGWGNQICLCAAPSSDGQRFAHEC